MATPGIGPGDVTTGETSVRKLSRGERTLWRASEGIGVVLHQPERRRAGQRRGELSSSPKGPRSTTAAPPSKPGRSTVTATVRVVFALE